MTDFVGRNPGRPHRIFAALESGDSIHGLTDGTWDKIDALEALSTVVGAGDLVISTWTAARRDISKALNLLDRSKFASMCWLVDRSFATRQPEYCDHLRATFGDNAIRVWDCHAKFAVLTTATRSALYLTSANLNRNRRIENFSLWIDGPLPGQYRDLVLDVFRAQRPGEAFDDPTIARKLTKPLLARPRSPSVPRCPYCGGDHRLKDCRSTQPPTG